MDLVKCWLLFFISTNIITFCKSMSLDEELILTQEQKFILDKFKEKVAGRLPHDYMYEEIYLIKWLRFGDYDIQKTTRNILNMVDWRERNKIDEIEKEDYSDLEKEFPYWVDGRDYEDRTVASGEVLKYDIRRVFVAGKSEKLRRYLFKVFEVCLRQVRDDQRNGRNVTQFTLIFTIDGFNLVQHACLQCIPFYVTMILELQANYPGLLHKLFLLNVPSSFEVVLRSVVPILTKEYREALAIYGTNKREWREAILKEIPEDQIRPQFGGTKNTDLDDY